MRVINCFLACSSGHVPNELKYTQAAFDQRPFVMSAPFVMYIVCVGARARGTCTVRIRVRNRGWWTALLSRVSLPEAPSTPFCFCCCLTPASCSRGGISGLSPELEQVHLLPPRACANI